MVYILTIIDYCTKWSICVPLRNQKATTVAEALMNNVFADFELPKIILTDQGTNFMSALLVNLMKFLGIDKKTSLPYTAFQNGQVERFHSILHQMLTFYVHDDQKHWSKNLKFALMAYRMSPHSSTGLSPFETLFGRQPILPSQLNHPLDDSNLYQQEELISRLQTNWSKAKEAIKDAQTKYKEQYDKNATDTVFTVGDLVYKLIEPNPGKWNFHYDGLYKIVSLTDTSATLQHTKSSRTITSHLNKLKKAYVRNE